MKIPASKSHTIRGLLIAAFADGESRLCSPLVSRDSLSCRNAVEALGAKVHDDGDDWIVRGFGNLPRTVKPHIDVGNSGTTLYLAAAMAALSASCVCFDGDSQTRRRSAAPLLDALQNMGVLVESNSGRTPFTITGPLSPGSIEIDCPVSQYLSGLLLATPLVQPSGSKTFTQINIRELNETPYVDITLDWLDFQGIAYERSQWDWFRVPAGQKYTAFERTVPGDWSSAAFFLAAAAVTRGTLILEGVDIKDSQGDRVILNMLKTMGCRWEEMPDGVKIEGMPLTGVEIDLNPTPDALPVMAAVACFAEGVTRLVNVPQARMKETDRISVMVAELRKLGIRAEELQDGMVIHGAGNQHIHGTLVDGHSDHRIVMALAVIGLGCAGEMSIRGAEAAEVTFPDFFTLMDDVLA